MPALFGSFAIGHLSAAAAGPWSAAYHTEPGVPKTGRLGGSGAAVVARSPDERPAPRGKLALEPASPGHGCRPPGAASLMLNVSHTIWRLNGTGLGLSVAVSPVARHPAQLG